MRYLLVFLCIFFMRVLVLFFEILRLVNLSMDVVLT